MISKCLCIAVSERSEIPCLWTSCLLLPPNHPHYPSRNGLMNPSPSLQSSRKLRFYPLSMHCRIVPCASELIGGNEHFQHALDKVFPFPATHRRAQARQPSPTQSTFSPIVAFSPKTFCGLVSMLFRLHQTVERR